jgi:hypothetical protein
MREVIKWALNTSWGYETIAMEADVHEHDVRNLLNTDHRPKHWAGLRMLWFAARLKTTGSAKPSEHILAKIEMLEAITRDLAVFEPDTDFFFRHLQRLGVVTERDCQGVCKRIAGHYYSHRLSRNPGKIIRSDYEFWRFSPFNRLPHVVNRLRYGSPNVAGAIERTAEGQIMQMGDTFVLLAFVYRGYDRGTRRKPASINYEGIQINLFPAGQMGIDPPSQIDGIFLSYVFDESYEIGRMKLIRKTKDKRKSNFDPTQVGEFTHQELQEIEPAFNPADLELDVTSKIEKRQAPGETDLAILTACLSFVMTREHLVQKDDIRS